jgi:hypothetical protein
MILRPLDKLLRDSAAFWAAVGVQTSLSVPRTLREYPFILPTLLLEHTFLKETMPQLLETGYDELYGWGLELDATLSKFNTVANPMNLAFETVMEKFVIGAMYLGANSNSKLMDSYLYDVLERKLTLAQGVATVTEFLQGRKALGEIDQRLDAALTELAVIELQLALEGGE